MGSGLLLVLAAWAGCILLSRKVLARMSALRDWRLSLISGTCLLALVLTLVVELLSLGSALTKSGLLLSWTVLAIAICIPAWKMSLVTNLSPGSVMAFLRVLRSRADALPRLAK